MITKQSSPVTGRVLVTFSLDQSVWADIVELWVETDGRRPSRLPMEQTRARLDWHVTVPLDEGKRYRFVYVVDGRAWNADLASDDCEVDAHGRVYGVVDTTPAFSYRLDLPLRPASVA